MKIKKGKGLELGINIFLLTLTLIVSNIVVLSTFNVLEYQIICSSFTYPFVFYFANRILKIVDKKTFIDVILATVFIQLIVFYLMNGEVLIGNFASVLAFFITQILNMLLFDSKTKKSEISFSQIFFVYASMLIIDGVLFNLFMNSGLDLSLMYSLVIKITVALIISVYEFTACKD